MRLTPRKEEIAAVKKILEDDQYDSAEGMAKDLIKEVARVLAMRPWFAGALFNEAGNQISPSYGPFSSESDAKAVFKKTGLGGVLRLAKFYGSSRLLANAEGKHGHPDFCQVCGCPDYNHATAGASRGHCVICGRDVCAALKR